MKKFNMLKFLDTKYLIAGIIIEFIKKRTSMTIGMDFYTIITHKIVLFSWLTA